MKRFLEPKTVQAVRRWLADKEVGGERVDPFSTPVEVGQYSVLPYPDDEEGRPQSLEQVRFRALIRSENGRTPTPYEAVGTVNRLSRLSGLPSLPWWVEGEIKIIV